MPWHLEAIGQRLLFPKATFLREIVLTGECRPAFGDGGDLSLIVCGTFGDGVCPCVFVCQSKYPTIQSSDKRALPRIFAAEEGSRGAQLQGVNPHCCARISPHWGPCTRFCATQNMPQVVLEKPSQKLAMEWLLPCCLPRMRFLLPLLSCGPSS